MRAARKAGQALELTGMLILAMPGIVPQPASFIVQQYGWSAGKRRRNRDFTNALMAIPYALKVLENPMRDVNSRYALLCQSLGIQGWRRLGG